MLILQEMLKHNTLENPEHFALHVRLVFENAQLFNLETSEIHHSATTLLELFNQKFADMCQRWKQQGKLAVTIPD